jgi:enoyl-[acyl-carrier protein] reductase II
MKNKVTELFGIKYPVIQAAMIWLSESNLVSAVNNAGGLGVIGINAGVDNPEPDPIKMGENLRSEIRKVRNNSKAPVVVNYFSAATPDGKVDSVYDIQSKKIMIEEKVEFVLMLGCMSDFVENEIKYFNDNNIGVIYREPCCTVEACIRAEKAGAKAIIVTGDEAGGHNTQYEVSLLSLLPQVTDAVKTIPVIAAGGIINEKGAKASLAMGADGVYCGTVFMTAEECRAHKNYKQHLIDLDGTDVITWNSSFASRMRTTKNTQGLTCYHLARSGADPMLIAKYYYGTFKASMLEGDIENGCVSVSGAIGGIKEIKSTKAIVEDLGKAFI